MGRHKKHDRPIRIHFTVRSSIWSQVEASMIDPLSKKRSYGSASELVDELLEGWLDGKFKTSQEPFRMNLEEFE